MAGLVVIPVFGHFEYAEAAVASALATTPDDVVVRVIDDASPAHNVNIVAAWKAHPRVIFTRRPANKGLTAGWNDALREVRGCEPSMVAVVGNSDLVFAPGWWERLGRAAAEYDLVGPVTNAPGHVSWQDVRRWACGYRASDQARDIAKTAAGLVDRKTTKTSNLNGFCLAATVKSWWEGAATSEDVFSAKFRLAGQEDELERRWRALGKRFAIVPSAYVFHYRSVTRGLQHGRGQTFRRKAIVNASPCCGGVCRRK